MADITGTGGNDTLGGTGDADTITALGGNDVVNAGDGGDTINGGTGNDTLNGEDGDDTFVEDSVTSSLDVFNGGAGFDTIELRAVPNPIVTTVGVLSPHALSAASSMVSIERLVFASQAGQVIQGTISYANWAASGLTQIVGGAGRDFLTVSIGPAAGNYTMPGLPISGWDPISLNAWEHVGDLVVLSSSASAADSVTLNALAGASFFQIIAGGRGNDVLNGSDNADSLNATLGGDTVNAGGGNDAITIVNSAPPSGGGFGAPSTHTGAGGTWDGGAGIDVISIGGAVNLQATLLNIEGVVLQEAFIPPIANTSAQFAAELTLDSAHIAMLPTNAFFSGVGTVIFNIDDDQSFTIPNYVITSGSDVSYVINAGFGDGLTFTGSAGDDFINLGVGIQTANGGDGSDVINVGVGVQGVLSQTADGGDGDDILILDNPAENTVMLIGGAGDDLLQLYSYSTGVPGFAPIIHAATSSNGGGISGIEAVQFVSVAGYSMQLIADIDAGFSFVIGGAGFDGMIFSVASAGTYTMPNFTLSNWNSAGGDFVALGIPGDSTFSVTLNGRNDIEQILAGGLAADTLNGGALSDRLFGGGGNDRLNGNGGNNFFDGGEGDDYIDASLGSIDTANGGDGDDTFAFGGSLTGADVIDGGSGNDQLGIVGNYTGANALVLGATTLTNVEVLAALPGGSYDITLHDANTAAGGRLTVFGGNLGVGDSFTVNGSAETDGDLITYGGLGVDTITGGSGNDGFYFGPNKYGASDTVTGGAGTNDQLALDGDYTITITSRENVEVLALLRGPTGTPNTFNITVADSFVPLGGSRIIWGAQLLTSLVIDASAESNGNLTFFGGTVGDTLTGGAGNDSISGGGGGDALRGGAGNDVFRYNDLSDSNGTTNTTRDRILDFASGDIINLGNIDAIAGGGDDAFSFIGGAAFSNVAGQLRSADNGNGTYTVEGDVDGDGVADFAILVTSAAPLGAGDFVL
jgi:Ca2+-binding RTX toxin-like protein